MQDDHSAKEEASFLAGARATYSEVNAVVESWPEGMQLPMAQSMGDGTIFAVVKFCDRKPVSDIDVETKRKFTIMLIDEFRRDEDRGKNYPYRASYIWSYIKMLHELGPVLKEMWERGEQEMALKLARTVCYGETLKFLDDHLDESRAALNKIIKEKTEQLPNNLPINS